MRTSVLFLVFICTSAVSVYAADVRFEPTWDSLDQRVTPDWYDKAKFGIFMHWGVYSVPSVSFDYFSAEWFWSGWMQQHEGFPEYMSKNYRQGFTYQEFAKDFTAEFFDPVQWADLFQRAGAKYVVITSKHHEGYTLWPSTYSYSWNSVDVGPHRDLIGELADAIRTRTNLRFGTYYSLLEWFNPLYRSDQANGYNTNIFAAYKVHPEIRELVEKYKPEILWADGEWEATSEYWNTAEFIAWLYNDSPVKDTVVVNDRWGSEINCKHGDFFTCSDRFNPGAVQEHKWENAMTVDVVSWGYRRNSNLYDYYSSFDLINSLVTTVSFGGNLLLNVGPRKDGVIDPLFQERLLDIGTWLSNNGEAIYETHPWKVQNDTGNHNVWYTQKYDVIYAIFLSWPRDNTLRLNSVVELVYPFTVISLLENSEKLEWVLQNSTVIVSLPDKATISGKYAWALKIVN